MQASCLSSLGDEDWEVVCGALSIRHLPSLPEAALLAALQALLRRLEALFLAPSRAADLPSAAASAAKQVLALVCQLASSAAAKGGAHAPALRDTAVLAVLDFALAPPHAKQVAKAAVKAARALGAEQALGEAAAALAGAVGSYEEAAEEEAEPSSKDAERQRGAKKERKLRRAHELRAGVASALIAALASQPAVLVPEVARLAAVGAGKAGQAADVASEAGAQGGSHLQARHLLLLALNGALLRLQAGGVPGTPAPKGKGKSKAAATPADAAAAVAATAATLQGVCLAELPAVGSAAPPGALQAWQDAAGTLLAADGAPTAQHTSESAEDLLTVHARLLCAALHSALKVTAEAGAAGGVDAGADAVQLRASFCEVASLAPPSAFHAHMALLLRTVLPQPEQRAAFLQQLYAAPAGSVPWQAQAAALMQHSVLGSDATPAPAPTPSKAKQTGAGAGAAAAFSWLPYLLAAASNARAEVRAAAAGCLLSLGNEMQASSPAASAVKALAQGLGSHHLLIGSDSDAAVRLVTNWLLPASEAGGAAAGGPDPAATPSKKQRGKAAKGAATAATSSQAPATDAGPASATPSSLDPASRRTLAAALASALPQLAGCSPADVSAAAALLGSVSAFAASLPAHEHEALLLRPTLAFLKALLSSVAKLDSAALASVLPSLARELVGLLARPELLQQAAGGADAARALAALLPALHESLLPLRRAALAALATQPSLLPALCAAAPDAHLPAFRALVASAAGDACPDCKRASRQALEAADVTADVLVPLLEAAVPAPAGPADAAAAGEGRKKRAKQQQQEAGEAGAAAGVVVDEEKLATAVMALELLQWKGVSSGPERVVAAAQALLQALLPHLGSIVVSHGSEAAAADDAGEAAVSAAAEPGSGEGQSSLAGYAAQLVMSGTDALLKAERAASAAAAAGAEKPAAKGSGRGKGAAKASSAAAGAPIASVLRLDLVVSVAQQAPDSAVRNAALSLVATAAAIMPDAVLGHVLQVRCGTGRVKGRHMWLTIRACTGCTWPTE